MDCCENTTSRRLVCPKPFRIGQSNLNNNDFSSSIMHPSFRFHTGNDDVDQGFDSKARAELLGMILHKDDFEAERYETISSSSPPPFCFGSPPCRTSNPLIQDAHFGVEKHSSHSDYASSPPSSSAHDPRSKFGKKKQANVIRVEGFGCQSSSFVAAMGS